MILDLFSGAGGAGIGLRRVCPDELIVHVDHDADCCATLRTAGGRLDHVLECEVDPSAILDRNGFAFPPVTGLWASPPCQPYSHAGKRRGAEDERDAWPETLAVIEATRPGWVVIENVRGSPAETWRSAIDRLGYLTGLWDLDAADYGVPQHRRRRFVVAWSPAIAWGGDGTRNFPYPPRRTHGPGGSLDYRPADFRWRPWVSIGEALPRLRGEAIAAWEEAIRLGILPPPAEHPAWWHRGSPVDEPSRAVGGQANASVDVRVDDRLDAPSSTVTTAGDARPHVRYPIGTGRAGSEPERLARPAPTVTAQEVKGTRASRASGWTFHGGPDRASDGAFLATGRRRLTPGEVGRLQDFPDGWPFQGTKTSVYRQIGNACPATLAEVVVRALLRRP